MTWLYFGKKFTSEMIGDYVGFVYEIENTTNGKRYIGKKLFSFKKIIRVKKKKKRTKVESDWESYYGSNEFLCEEVQKIGAKNFKRSILRLCKTKTELGYYELKYQMENDVLLKPDEYYNCYIGYRANRKNLVKDKK